MNHPLETIKTQIWLEEASDSHAFITEKQFLRGYDVQQDLLPNLSWHAYLYLLFFAELPEKNQLKLFETLSIALANPGPRDQSVLAAMTAGAAGATQAASLISALAAGAGVAGGAREIFYLYQVWQDCGGDAQKWCEHLPQFEWPHPGETFAKVDHLLGFLPYEGVHAHWVHAALQKLVQLPGAENFLHLQWLHQHHAFLEKKLDSTLAITLVATAAFLDLQFNAEQAELLFLLLRLPGTAAHAYEQRILGITEFPFWPQGINYQSAV
jgi:citrate synthase